MLTRREFLQITAATAVLTGGMGLTKLSAQQSLSQDDLLKFDPLGNVTLIHFTDCHAQLVPVYFREPSINLGVGAAAGLPPHITGKDLLSHYDIAAGAPEAYALGSEDYTALAKAYGRVGGMDRVATVVKAIRAERPQALFLDGGDTWQGSLTSLRTNGSDMVRVMNAMGVDAMTGHWEFTLGAERCQDLIQETTADFLAGNVVDRDWEEPVFEAFKLYEQNGVPVAVIGQAFPYTPVANPRWMIPEWSFGIREETVQAHVNAARAAGAQVVVLLSHNGFDVDRKLAGNVEGLDVVLTGHTHDALPRAEQVGQTLLIASGSHSKFVSRLDLDVQAGKVADYRFKLIPIFADVITPDPEMSARVAEIRAPYTAELETVLGKTESLLYRRGNFNGTFDDLICEALLAERDAEIALSPGFRWGATLLPGQDITVEDVYNVTAMSYPAAYRLEFTGAMLKDILEDVADNLFNPDPYLQQGGDMVRVGGMGYSIDVTKPIGQRISDLTLLKSGEPIDPSRAYVVAGWASVNEGTEGPAIYDLVSDFVRKQGTVRFEEHDRVKIKV